MDVSTNPIVMLFLILVLAVGCVASRTVGPVAEPSATAVPVSVGATASSAP